jgi:hypothetical protein
MISRLINLAQLRKHQHDRHESWGLCYIWTISDYGEDHDFQHPLTLFLILDCYLYLAIYCHYCHWQKKKTNFQGDLTVWHHLRKVCVCVNLHIGYPLQSPGVLTIMVIIDPGTCTYTLLHSAKSVLDKELCAPDKITIRCGKSDGLSMLSEVE